MLCGSLTSDPPGRKKDGNKRTAGSCKSDIHNSEENRIDAQGRGDPDAEKLAPYLDLSEILNNSRLTPPPEVKRCYRVSQEAGEEIEAICVDVSRMPYVSSAGLRVLLMMYKSLEDKDKFEMTGVSEDVREILETTGFDQFLL